MDKHGLLPNWGSTDHIDTETLRMSGFVIHLPFSSEASIDLRLWIL
jgi:hypothetical protein